jgi:ATP-dependent Clp protease ATP-binding subunit ClpB
VRLPGYVGYEEGGQLTEAVRRRPYSVVLLDEVEKAHPEVFDILLQVLDDGRLTDGQGRTVDFRNVILVLTSNLGSQFLVDPTLDAKAKRNAVMATVNASFKPEFLNRLDEVVLFDPLSVEELARIVELQVAELTKRLGALHERRLDPRPGLRAPPCAAKSAPAPGWPCPASTHRLRSPGRCAGWSAAGDRRPPGQGHP